MKILKSSAGSGKTYSLTREYIRLLLQSESPDAYRHILAVTFTNKATDEMKKRIISELSTLATDPAHSPYLNDFVPGVIANIQQLKDKAQWHLTGILHDYSSFAVSTIDRFFQQTLRAFSHEIGQFGAYQVELDKDMLVDDAVSRVMQGLSPAKPGLLKWVVDGVKADLESTGRFTLERRLVELAHNIVNEDKQAFTYSREKLIELRNACDEIVSSFAGRLIESVATLTNALRDAGIEPSDTNRGFLKAALAYADIPVKEFIQVPTKAFMEKARDPEKWFAKAKANLLPVATDYIYGPLMAFCDLFGAAYREYATAFSLREQVYGLGMADELREAFLRAQRERGVISIEDTNSIIHGIIDGTDTPFLYEKLGVRYEHFLLDEFQDTSTMQWENFLPLVSGAEANGNENLIVGDVKQSIYRWRGSDWNLLDKKVQSQLRTPDSSVEVLDGNYRTAPAIVEFNNGFFPYAADVLDASISDNGSENGRTISEIYRDVRQKIRVGGADQGEVKVRFVDGTEKQLDEIVDTIHDVLSRGAHYSDIAILVRGNSDGTLIAERLVRESIPVISDDSLYVKGSVTIRRLISQLSLIARPERVGEGDVDGYLAEQMNISAPTCYHGLVDLSESILSGIRSFSPELFDAESAYIQAYMDWLKDWTGKNGNSLSDMLSDWAEAQPKIVSPEGTDAVRVMTIHKSKGLEFPYVIFPFSEKVTTYRAEMRWCRPNVKGTALDGLADGMYQALLGENSSNTLNEESYRKERFLQAVDNLNVFYVALTRAQYGLKVISSMPPKSFIESVTKGTELNPKTLSQILYSYLKETEFFKGVEFNFNTMPRKHKRAELFPLHYTCSHENATKRMVFRVKDEIPVAAVQGTLF